LLETLWGIVCEFVLLGYGVHPVQQVQQTCAKDRTQASQDTLTDSPTLESGEESLVQAFIAAYDLANETTTREGENTHADL
jgi:hypothetical protein